MKSDIHEEVEIPEGINAKIENGEISLRKGEAVLKRKLERSVNVKVENNKIIFEAKKATKRERKITGSLKAHCNNMIRGLTEKFRYRLESASVHFPVTIIFDKQKSEIAIKNFLGEKIDRRVKIDPRVEVKINKNIIEVESSDKELAGQAAANIEKGAKIRKRDRRIYQDGIYVVEKPGRTVL
jgi:large subunit ribosomal protein L6